MVPRILSCRRGGLGWLSSERNWLRGLKPEALLPKFGGVAAPKNATCYSLGRGFVRLNGGPNGHAIGFRIRCSSRS